MSETPPWGRLAGIPPPGRSSLGQNDCLWPQRDLDLSIRRGMCAHTVSPSIRGDPGTRLSGSRANHQLADAVVTTEAHKGPILSTFNIKTSTKHLLCVDQKTKRWNRIQGAVGTGEKNNAHVRGQVIQGLFWTELFNVEKRRHHFPLFFCSFNNMPNYKKAALCFFKKDFKFTYRLIDLFIHSPLQPR